MVAVNAESHNVVEKYDMEMHTGGLSFHHFINNPTEENIIVYLGGLHTNACEKTGNSKNFVDFLKQNNLNGILVDYPGHGEDAGSFIDVTLSKILESINNLLTSKFSKKNIVLMGSSIGTHLALLVAGDYKTKPAFKGLVLINPRIDYPRHVYSKMSSEEKKLARKKGYINETSYGRFPIYPPFIDDAITNNKVWVLKNGTVGNIKCPIHVVSEEISFREKANFGITKLVEKAPKTQVHEFPKETENLIDSASKITISLVNS